LCIVILRVYEFISLSGSARDSLIKITGDGKDLKIRVHHDDPSQREHSKTVQTGQAVLGRGLRANDLTSVDDRAECEQTSQPES